MDPTSRNTLGQSAHKQVAARDGADACWRCGLRAKALLRVARQFSSHDAEQFLAYADEPLRLVPKSTTHDSHLSNLVLLCQNCHALFEMDSPAWVMLPADVEFFIQFEKADYEARILAGNEGITRYRTVPTTKEVDLGPTSTS